MKKIIITGLSLFLGLGLLVTAPMAWAPGFGRGFGGGREFLHPALPILGEKQFHEYTCMTKKYNKEAKRKIYLEDEIFTWKQILSYPRHHKP